MKYILLFLSGVATGVIAKLYREIASRQPQPIINCEECLKSMGFTFMSSSDNRKFASTIQNASTIYAEQDGVVEELSHNDGYGKHIRIHRKVQHK